MNPVPPRVADPDGGFLKELPATPTPHRWQPAQRPPWVHQKDFVGRGGCAHRAEAAGGAIPV